MKIKDIQCPFCGVKFSRGGKFVFVMAEIRRAPITGIHKGLAVIAPAPATNIELGKPRVECSACKNVFPAPCRSIPGIALKRPK